MSYAAIGRNGNEPTNNYMKNDVFWDVASVDLV
jgi:hypothetical protein